MHSFVTALLKFAMRFPAPKGWPELLLSASFCHCLWHQCFHSFPRRAHALFRVNESAGKTREGNKKKGGKKREAERQWDGHDMTLQFKPFSHRAAFAFSPHRQLLSAPSHWRVPGTVSPTLETQHNPSHIRDPGRVGAGGIARMCTTAYVT